MTKFLYAHLMKLTPNELHKALSKRNLPQETYDQIRDTVERQKEEQRVRKIKRAAHRKLWIDLLNPLADEIKAVRGSLCYRGADNEERIAALSAYETLLLRVNRKLREIKSGFDMTPADAAAEAKIPNKGEHWTDWVPSGKRQAIIALFDAIPHKPRAKRKIPFERKVPVESARSKLTHQRAIYEGRLQGMQQLLLLYKDDERYQRMGHVKETEDKIADLESRIKDLDQQIAGLNKG
jgi:hypothetical protein